jgi:catalase
MIQGVHVVDHAIGLAEVSLNLDMDKDHVISSYGVVTTGKYNLTGSAVVDILPGATEGFASNFAYQISKHRCYEREEDGLTSKVAY